VTKLEHARELKQVKMPLNMQVEERTFSLDYTKHWEGLMNSHGDFMRAVYQYTTGTHAGLPANGSWCGADWSRFMKHIASA